MNVLTLEERIKVIRESESGKSQRQLSLAFKCSKTQIQRTLAQRDSYLNDWEENRQTGKKKKRKKTEINEQVWEWYKESREKGFWITGTMLQKKARELARLTDNQTFAASNGWLGSFVKSHDIKLKRHQESTKWITDFSDVMSRFDPWNIYILLETGLFFKALPNEIPLLKKDGESATDRVTLMLLINQYGGRENPAVIYHQLQPFCYRNTDLQQLPVEWRASPTARLTTNLFEEWLKYHNNGPEYYNSEKLLFLNRNPCHTNIKQPVSHITLCFFPENTHFNVSCFQSIIQSFKLHYRTRLLKYINASVSPFFTATDVAERISVSDAAYWIKKAWDKVPSGIVQDCFRTCGITETCDNRNNTMELQVSTLCEDTSELQLLINQITDGVNVEDFVNFDNDLNCFDEQCREQELQNNALLKVKSTNTLLKVESDGTYNPNNNAEPLMTLPEAMLSVSRHKRLAEELGDSKLWQLASQLEDYYIETMPTQIANISQEYTN